MQGIELRDIAIQKQISTHAGFYRWFMPPELVKELKVPFDGCEYIRKIIFAIITLPFYFIGGIIGNAKYKFGTEPSENNYVYGGEAGFELNFSEHFSIDMFGRYTAAKLARVNNYIQSGIGLNYKF